MLSVITACCSAVRENPGSDYLTTPEPPTIDHLPPSGCNYHPRQSGGVVEHARLHGLGSSDARCNRRIDVQALGGGRNAVVNLLAYLAHHRGPSICGWFHIPEPSLYATHRSTFGTIVGAY